MYLYCLTCETVEDILLFIRVFPFLSMIFGPLVSIRDPTVRVPFRYNSHSYRLLLRSLFRYKSILSFPLAQLLLYGSEYNGSHKFVLKPHKIIPIPNYVERPPTRPHKGRSESFKERIWAGDVRQRQPLPNRVAPFMIIQLARSLVTLRGN